MRQEDVVAVVTSHLATLGVPYMLVGSLASTRHGAPRMTQDADVVVDATADQLAALARLLAGSFYASEPALRAAAEKRGIANVIHLESGLKVDLILRRDRPFSREELARRASGPLGDHVTWFASAEDTVLSKLEWAKRGGSERQYLDALRVCQVQGDRLDWPYVERWAPDLGVSDLVLRLRADLA